MPKKIYDVKPPKMAVKKERKPRVSTKVAVNKTVTKKPVKEEIKKIEKAPETFVQQKKEGRPVWFPVSISIGVILVVIGAYLFFKLPKADITIWPKVETLSFEQKIVADKSVNSVSLENNIIPVQYFEVTKTNSQDFPATGNASNEGKATGNIVISNKYDPPAPFTFKAGTRFVSDSGKLFITYQKVTIPAAQKVGGKIIPGTVQIEVQAVEGGSDYNIAPSSFSIPGLKGTSYYYSITATSANAMTGGYAGKVKKVTEDDIQSAKDVLTKKSTADAMAALKAQIPEGYILLDNAILSNVESASTQAKSGSIVESFNYETTVKASALAFKKSDIDQFAKDYIASKMAEGKTLLDDTYKIEYSSSIADISGGKETLNLKFSTGVYQNVDKNSVVLSVLGKNAEQISNTINNNLGSEVFKVQTKFWPFWVSSSPNNQKAVNIELKFQ